MKLELTKNHPMVKDFYWLTQVQGSKSDKRQHMNTVLIKDNVAYKTDGSRLFFIYLDKDYEWIDGVYDIIKRTKSLMILVKRDEESRWPDLESIFMETSKAYKSFDIYQECIETGIKKIMVALTDTEATVNVKWIMDLVVDRFEFHLMDEYGNKPFILTSGNKIAYVMPMRYRS